MKENPRFSHTAYLDDITYLTSIEVTSLQRTASFCAKHKMYQICTSKHLDAFSTDSMNTNRTAATPRQFPDQQLPALNVATTPLQGAEFPPPTAMVMRNYPSPASTIGVASATPAVMPLFHGRCLHMESIEESAASLSQYGTSVMEEDESPPVVGGGVNGGSLL